MDDARSVDVKTGRKGRTARPRTESKGTARMEVTLLTTLHEARDYVHDNADRGVICPVCDQHLQRYRRPLHSMMAFALVLIDRRLRASEEWLHVTTFLIELDLPSAVLTSIRGDWPKLRHWGLIEPKPGLRKDKSKRNGFYRMTELGRHFVRGEVKVPQYLSIQNNKLCQAGGEQVPMIDIHEAFGVKFDYARLMGYVEPNDELHNLLARDLGHPPASAGSYAGAQATET